MVITEEVAKLIVDFNYDSIPERGIKQSKAAIIDSIGAGLLGYGEAGRSGYDAGRQRPGRRA